MYEKLATRLKRIRKEKKLSIHELAMRMRVSKESISKLEQGKTPPTPQQADVIRAFIAGKL